MRILLFVLLFFVSCTVNFSKDVVSYKERTSDITKDDCKYMVRYGFGHLNFIAPCDYYDVGDSLNKWYRKYKLEISKDSIGE